MAGDSQPNGPQRALLAGLSRFRVGQTGQLQISSARFGEISAAELLPFVVDFKVPIPVDQAQKDLPFGNARRR
jgi:hypothetical protein